MPMLPGGGAPAGGGTPRLRRVPPVGTAEEPPGSPPPQARHREAADHAHRRHRLLDLRRLPQRAGRKRHRSRRRRRRHRDATGRARASCACLRLAFDGGFGARRRRRRSSRCDQRARAASAFAARCARCIAPPPTTRSPRCPRSSSACAAEARRRRAPPPRRRVQPRRSVTRDGEWPILSCSWPGFAVCRCTFTPRGRPQGIKGCEQPGARAVAALWQETRRGRPARARCRGGIMGAAPGPARGASSLAQPARSSVSPSTRRRDTSSAVMAWAAPPCAGAVLEPPRCRARGSQVRHAARVAARQGGHHHRRRRAGVGSDECVARSAGSAARPSAAHPRKRPAASADMGCAGPVLEQPARYRRLPRTPPAQANPPRRDLRAAPRLDDSPR